MKSLAIRDRDTKLDSCISRHVNKFTISGSHTRDEIIGVFFLKVIVTVIRTHDLVTNSIAKSYQIMSLLELSNPLLRGDG